MTLSLFSQERLCELYHMLSGECPHLVELYESIILDMLQHNQQQQTHLAKMVASHRG